MSSLGFCIAQTYLGGGRAAPCPRVATVVTVALDGSHSRLCAEHASIALAAGAREAGEDES